jgi:hypothetical protein
MQIERGASNTFALLGRSILSPSYWLLWFRDPERNASVYCIATASNTTGGMLTLTFTETNTPTALDGEVKLSPRGNWELKVYEQTSPTNLDPANAGRLVKTIGLLVVGPEASDTGWSGTACPTDGDECDPLRVLVNGERYATIEDPCGGIASVKVVQGAVEVGELIGDQWVIPTCDDLSYSLVNSNNVELDGGSVPDPCGEQLTLNAPDAVIRTTDTLLGVAAVPSGDVYDLPQTSVMYAFPGGVSQLFLTDTTFDQLNLQTQDFIFMADLRNSVGTALADVTAADLMNDTVPIAPDGTITFDGLSVGTVPSGDTENLDCGTLLNAAYVQDGGSVTGTYLITGTLNGRNVYTLDGSHNLEYTGSRWRLVKPGSDVDAALGSESFPWDADWSATSVTVQQATIGAYCGGNEVPCADLTVAINGTTYGTVADPCGATADVDVEDSNGNPVGSLVSGAWVVAPPANVLREFTAGGSWSKPTDASFQGVWVFAAGGGGSGGAGGAGNVVSSPYGGGGGGGGAIVRLWIPSASLGLTETYAIGAGGAGVATGNGGAGGATLFGAHVDAKGGGGGVQGGASNPAQVAGGSALLCIPLNNAISGAPGQRGQRDTITTAAGAAVIANVLTLGGGIATSPVATGGAGGGGGGGYNNATANGAAGGDGGGAYNSNTLTNGGAGGAFGGGNGTAGASDIYLDPFLGIFTTTIGLGTGGGGGGGASGATAGGTGAASGRAAGGGGGGSTQTGTRGASGAGGDGFLLVYEVFAI